MLPSKFTGDIKEIDKCNIVVAINHGLRSDSSIAFEVGYAFANKKPVFIVYFDETIDSLMINNTATGCINYKDFENNSKLDILKYEGILSQLQILNLSLWKPMTLVIGRK